MERCKFCRRWIYQDSGESHPWNVRDDETDDEGVLLRRRYNRTCAPSPTGEHKPVNEHEVEDEPLEPKFFDNGDKPVSARNVRAGYRNLVESINRVNQMLDPDERFCVPFGVQEAVARYIDEREAVASITGDMEEA